MTILRRSLPILLVVLMASGVAACDQIGALFKNGGEQESEPAKSEAVTSATDLVEGSAPSTIAEPAATEAATDQNKETRVEQVAIISTRLGDMVVRFFPDLAPKHVESFKKLASEGFYDGTIFHRVIPGFMIQGGDPNTKDLNHPELYGTGGPGYTIKAEFSDRRHVRGILSAARSMNPDSAGSQFFVMVADAPHLDGQYSVFGQVIEGLDVADKIVAEKRDGRDNPLERVEMTVKLEEREFPAE